MDTTVTTLLTVPAVLGLVTITKDLGLPAKLAPLAAIAIGVTIAVLETQLGHLPIVRSVESGILLALAACGLYDTAQIAALGTREERL